ncbi:MAG: conjugative transposon protein TraN [Candidatus Pseudobacter hemicellulosilyticus]|uniref:Conjugative transposon protein TraN n=1 Tax=Candidatus Pseudobacter hemicellulosilyticus TaxID=3121375 RepID=A0AAJ6BHB2_9BACT|nr:MAG: conjugative transposon protein TraN [Pseudobacter sp.]
MKRNRAGVMIVLLFWAIGVKSQVVRTQMEGVIEPFDIGVSDSRTVNLIFPYSIKGVDRGNPGLMVLKAPGAENVLHVKAGSADFEPTNLTVLTGEGAIYSFMVFFTPAPSLLNIRIEAATSPGAAIILSQGEASEAEMARVMKAVAEKQRSIKGPRKRLYAAELSLQGVYIHDDRIFLQLEFRNDSHMALDVSQFRMYIRDRKESKRTAIQELEVLPVYTHGDIKRIEGKSRHRVVLVLDKFTIPDKKNFVIQLLERGGGRHLSIKVKNKDLVRAKLI